MSPRERHRLSRRTKHHKPYPPTRRSTCTMAGGTSTPAAVRVLSWRFGRAGPDRRLPLSDRGLGSHGSSTRRDQLAAHPAQRRRLCSVRREGGAAPFDPLPGDTWPALVAQPMPCRRQICSSRCAARTPVAGQLVDLGAGRRRDLADVDALGPTGSCSERHRPTRRSHRCSRDSIRRTGSPCLAGKKPSGAELGW
jgi:hypothetical protein